MNGFTIGEVPTECGKTQVSLVDKGVSIYNRQDLFGFGGLGSYTPAEARQLGLLLINAADRWAELNAHVKQAEADIEAVNRSVKAKIKDFLA